MLNFSHLAEYRLKPVHIHECLDTTLTRLNAQIAHHQIPIAVQKHYGNLPKILCHGDDLNQVFISIIVNALEAIEQSHRITMGEIRIQTFKQDNHVVIRISNNGPMISANLQDQIFDPFFTTKPEARGLGLSISRSIVVDRHQGQILCHSRTSETYFEVHLPLKPSPIALEINVPRSG
jgi:two-component system, NtrC family, sensor kinase